METFLLNVLGTNCAIIKMQHFYLQIIQCATQINVIKVEIRSTCVDFNRKVCLILLGKDHDIMVLIPVMHLYHSNSFVKFRWKMPSEIQIPNSNRRKDPGSKMINIDDRGYVSNIFTHPRARNQKFYLCKIFGQRSNTRM